MMEGSESVKLIEVNETPQETCACNNNENKHLSKRQLKKEAKRLKWQEKRKITRVLEREKQKLKRQKLKEVTEKLGLEPPKKIRKLMKDSECKLRVAIDLSFDNLMSPLEINKVVKQIQRCYSNNRRAEKPVQLYLTSFNDDSKKALSDKEGCLNWDVYYEEDYFTNVFEKEAIVYLTSDSPNTIEELDDSKVYIIGGLVDHNHQRGLCYNLALKNEISHGKLPINQYFDMKTRQVLTINHVFDILLAVAGGRSWEESLLETLPQRKGARLKSDVQTSHEESRDDESTQIEPSIAI